MLDFIKRATSAIIAGAISVGTLALYPNLFNGNRTVNAASMYDSATLVTMPLFWAVMLITES